MPKVNQDGRPVEQREASPEEDRIPGPVYLLLQLFGLGVVVLGLAIVILALIFSFQGASEQTTEQAWVGGGIAFVGLVALAIAARRRRSGNAATSGENDWRDVVDEAVSRTFGQLILDAVFWGTLLVLALAAIWIVLAQWRGQ